LRANGAKSLRRTLLLASLGSLALACAHPYFTASDAPRGDALRTLQVLPLNFEFAPPSEWLEGIARVQALVQSRLEASGHSVRPVPMRTVLELWSSALREVGGVTAAVDPFQEPRYRQARVLLAERLLADGDADAVVMPTLVPRTAEIEGRTLLWDGVKRKLEVESVDATVDRKYTQTPNARVASLRISVFDRKGELLFERLRGLEPLVWIRVERGHYRVEDRTKLFQDEALLSDEVRTAFEPFLVAPTP